MAYLNKDIWRQHIDGYWNTDCAVRDRNIVHLCLREKVPAETASRIQDHDRQTRQLAIYLDTPDDPFGAKTLTGYSRPVLGVALRPKAQCLLAARNSSGQVSIQGGGRNQPDEFIAPDQWPLTQRIKCIGGHAYSVGGQRQIYKRSGIGQWEAFASLPGTDKMEDMLGLGFSDMDAFSESDMYAVGGRGDVWHFDGSSWQPMGFPSNVQLGTVTCAGDGKVYISGEGGSLWVGEHSTWEPIHTGNASILWNDVLWFNDQLWLASDYQLRVWDGKTLKAPQHDGRPVPVWGHMDARDGLLVVASPDVVMAFDGNTWRTLVAPYLD